MLEQATKKYSKNRANYDNLSSSNNQDLVIIFDNLLNSMKTIEDNTFYLNYHKALISSLHLDQYLSEINQFKKTNTFQGIDGFKRQTTAPININSNRMIEDKYEIKDMKVQNNRNDVFSRNLSLGAANTDFEYNAKFGGSTKIDVIEDIEDEYNY
jgi:hypothetical protein